MALTGEIPFLLNAFCEVVGAFKNIVYLVFVDYSSPILFFALALMMHFR